MVTHTRRGHTAVTSARILAAGDPSPLTARTMDQTAYHYVPSYSIGDVGKTSMKGVSNSNQ